MALHIGEKIHELVKIRGFSADYVAKAVNISESSLYKIYKREFIDDDKLQRFSKLFDTTDLYAFRLQQKPYKDLLEKKQSEHKKAIESLEHQITIKEKRISELVQLTNAQQQTITLLQEKINKDNQPK